MSKKPVAISGAAVLATLGIALTAGCGASSSAAPNPVTILRDIPSAQIDAGTHTGTLDAFGGRIASATIAGDPSDTAVGAFDQIQVATGTASVLADETANAPDMQPQDGVEFIKGPGFILTYTNIGGQPPILNMKTLASQVGGTVVYQP
jgi:hypothetical protein